MTDYQLTSCAGVTDMLGRQARNLTVSSLDGSSSVDIPIVIECNHISDIRNEIPTPDVARSYTHLQDIADDIPEVDKNVPILTLIGRDTPEAHHVAEQQTGPRNSPFAQRLTLGWVIVGESCLNKVHRPNSVVVNKTYLLPNGRTSMFQPCPNDIHIEVHNKDTSHYSQDLDSSIFMKRKDDETVGLSVDDKDFIRTMDQDVHISVESNWEAPLPFREKRQPLPNNSLYALKRAQNLDISLRKDPTKQEHFMSFMKKIFDNNHAEIAPPLKEKEECWYLPIFGVYHPKKPSQIRAVFDSYVKFQNISLNDVLLYGPDLNNKPLVVLLRFRKEPIAVTADIESMFHCFQVEERHRNFLRFFWYKYNDINNPLIEFRMRVHVFGNSPSPAFAVYCLRKAACAKEDIFGPDVTDFVSRNFYVDDGLISLPTADEAIDLLK
ncbi:uncharacterized protein LOC134245361 [Saccostrea cucullata]|uniref:uncharacterized protein LOC134245361 n=1 Tax=Saccostrea cuccullata TaxID=36930 RepID=UPI002ED5BBC0